MEIIQNWLFEVPPNHAIYTTDYVILQMKPVLRVSRSNDDVWQFLSEEGADENSIKIVQLKTMLERHPEMIQLADLPRGWEAWRSSDSDAWNRGKDPDEH